MYLSIPWGKNIALGCFLITLFIGFGGFGEVSFTQAQTAEGFGKLRLGMTPSEVQALEGCQTEHNCLYGLLGKNRYFTLSYGKNGSTPDSVPSPTATLSLIEIDMGNHTDESFGELYEALASQYPVYYIPTETDDIRFQDGTNNEIPIGFADGSVLLKVVRRPFGNQVLKVVYQNKSAAQAQREVWAHPPQEPTPQ